MSVFLRYLSLVLPQGQSAFLWGARKTGKSTYLKQKFPKSVYYDLLKSDTYARLLTEPHLFREEVLSLSSAALKLPIIIDEVQKIPMLLNEVHWLIENSDAYFILCGSSARKLKRGAANLLGGRAWRFTFYPLIYPEIEQLDLLRTLNQGLLPSHYLTEYPERALRAYIHDYLKEEIQAESLTRNLPHFVRFLDAVSFCQGELINYSNIARDCGIDARTVKDYFQILVDTLVGYYVYPYHKNKKRQIISSTPKFYLFDVGVSQYLAKQTILQLKGAEAGKAFEHYIFMELQGFLGLQELDYPIYYWRTKQGFEVDFYIEGFSMAIEVKISNCVHKQDLKGLIAFCEDYQPKKAIVVCLAPRARRLHISSDVTIDVLPWRDFLTRLWSMEFTK